MDDSLNLGLQKDDSMKIIDELALKGTHATAASRRILRDGTERMETRELLGEVLLKICVDGESAGEIMCTPERLPELVTGWLRYAGKITAADEIETIRFFEEPKTAPLRLAAEVALRPSKAEAAPVRSDASSLQPADLFALADRFDEGLPQRERTGATHNCMLAQVGGAEPEILCRSEDAGRHSAMDKAIGWGLLHDVDFSACLLYASGRTSRAMVLKAVRAGVQTLAGRSHVSLGAVRLAAESGLTLVGFCDGRGMNVYAPERRMV